MEKRNIGKSGLSAPFLGLGTWAIGGGSWWGDNDDALSVKAIETAVEQGITWIDTAPIYGLYHSEEVVGEALRHIDRDKVILSTKCGLEWRHESPVLHKVVDGVQTYRDLSAKSIIEDVEDSLRRLGTDHLDVLYTHWQTPDLSIFPLEETVEAMMKLKEQGKIRAIGASNTTAEFIRGYCKYGQLDVIQEKYSLLTRRIEKQLLPTCKELGVSIQAYSPLEQGLLTGKATLAAQGDRIGLVLLGVRGVLAAVENLIRAVVDEESGRAFDQPAEEGRKAAVDREGFLWLFFSRVFRVPAYGIENDVRVDEFDARLEFYGIQEIAVFKSSDCASQPFPASCCARGWPRRPCPPRTRATGVLTGFLHKCIRRSGYQPR